MAKLPYLSDAPAITFATNLDLEEQIRRNPNDASRRLVYADWLTTQNDPRGELASVQNALAQEKTGTKYGELNGRQQQILEANGGFLGGVSPEVLTIPEWNGGLFKVLRLMNFTDWMDSKFDAGAVAERAFDLPGAVALDELRIGVLRWEYQEKDLATTLEAASKRPFAKTLRHIMIGDVRDIDIDNAHHELGSIDLVNKFPALESLYVWGSALSLSAPLDLPELRSLTIKTCGLSGDMFTHLAKSNLPKLEKLEVWFGSEDYGASVSVDQLASILDGSAFPKLKELGICNAEFTDAAAAAVLESKILKQLERLDFKKGVLLDSGARPFVEKPDAWRHLKELDVSENYLSEEMEAELGKVSGVAIVGGDSKLEDAELDEDEQPEYRYVSMAE